MKKVKVKQQERFNIVSLTDWHVPYEDPIAIALAFKFCEEMQPDVIVMHELHDFYSLSKFDKNPSRRINIQDEVDQVNKYVARLRKLCPKSRFILLKSNHLDRLRRYLWTQAPALSNLRALQIEQLLELDKNNVEYMEDWMYKDVLFKHGSVVRQDSSYTAKGEFLKEGCSGVSGHTHRLGTYFSTKRGGKYVWMESGCLCNVKAEYLDGTANWQQGISVVSFKKNSRKFYPTVIPIVDNTITWGSKYMFV